MHWNESAAVADYIASHALTFLLLLTLLGSCLSALLWRAIVKVGPALRTSLVRAWIRLAGDQALDRMRSWPYADRAVDVARLLGIYAVCCLIFAFVAVSGFLELAEAIDVEEELGRFDGELSDAMRAHLSARLLRVLSVVTHLGDFAVLAALSVVMSLVLFFKRERVLAAACLIATAGGGALTTLLKHHFARARPLYEHSFAQVDGYSFPSGHASGSMLVYGLLGYLAVRHTPAKWHIPVVILTMAAIVFIGGSRVLLQVHFLSDVLAGWISAAAWLALWTGGLESMRRRN